MIDDKRRLRQSLRNYKRLLDLEPGHLGHLEHLARLCAELGKPRDAAQFLTQRARCLADQGRVAAALQDCETALGFHPRRRETRKLRERLVLEHPQPSVGAGTGLGLPPLTPMPLTAPTPAVPPLQPLSRPTPAPAGGLSRRPATTPIARPVAPEKTPSPGGLLTPPKLPSLKPPLPVDASELMAVRRHESLDIMPVDEVFDASDALVVHEIDALLEPEPATISRPPTAVAPSDAMDAQITAELPAAPVEGRSTLSADGPPVQLPDSPGTPPLDALPDVLAQALVDSGQRRRFEAGERVLAEGAPFAGVVLVLDGWLRVAPDGDDAQCQPVGPGQLLGLNLLEAEAWPTSVFAQTNAWIVTLPVDHFVDAISGNPAFSDAVTVAAARERWALLLAKSRLFRGLSPADRASLLDEAEPRIYTAGEAVFEAGELVPGVFLLTEGHVKIAGASRALSTLSAGDSLGVIAALTRQRAAGTATAGSLTRALFIKMEAVQWALRHAPVERAFQRAADMRQFVLGKG